MKKIQLVEFTTYAAAAIFQIGFGFNKLQGSTPYMAIPHWLAGTLLVGITTYCAHRIIVKEIRTHIMADRVRVALEKRPDAIKEIIDRINNDEVVE